MTIRTLIVSIGLLCAGVAAAAPPPTSAPSDNLPTSPSPSQPVLALSCDITPAAIPGPGEFQGTQVTVGVKSGTPAANKQVEIRLGTRSDGRLLKTVCSSEFGRDKSISTTVTIGPPITDRDYVWKCNARQLTKDCEAAPPPPR